ncbi:MAG: cytochrome c3 family protein [Gammaproteobacteria bacterium]|nr:cytochrome c3 family protein [Gammaproteobacteria bacterium]
MKMTACRDIWIPFALCAAFLLAPHVASAQDDAAAAFPAGQDAPYWIRGNHFQLTGEVVSIPEDGIHDPTVATAQVLQPPFEAMANFPRDSQGVIDWVKTLETGLIDPRKSLDGTGEMFPVDFDIIFKNTQSMPYVRFPHRQHTEWLTCANCHPLIFIPQKGANPVSMSAIIQGEYCGVCHGKVAFPPTMNCGRCHSVAKEVTLLR